MAAVFVEKVLRVQPNVKKLYLLLRAADAKSATQRLHNEVIYMYIYIYITVYIYTHIYMYRYHSLPCLVVAPARVARK